VDSRSARKGFIHGKLAVFSLRFGTRDSQFSQFCLREVVISPPFRSLGAADFERLSCNYGEGWGGVLVQIFEGLSSSTREEERKIGIGIGIGVGVSGPVKQREPESFRGAPKCQMEFGCEGWDAKAFSTASL